MSTITAASHTMSGARPVSHDNHGGGLHVGIHIRVSDDDDSDSYDPQAIDDQVTQGYDRDGLMGNLSAVYARTPGGVSGNPNGVAHTLQLPFSPREYQGPALTDMSTFHNADFGSNWRNQAFGFNLDDDGYMLAATPSYAASSSWNPENTTLFEMDPVTGFAMGPLGSPEKSADGFEMAPFKDTNELYATMLNGMASPNNFTGPTDNSAGLYLATPDFNPSQPPAPTAKLTGANAMDSLQKGQAIFFHPPNGQWEKLSNLQDLNMYLYTQEPGQPPTPSPAA